MSLMTGMCRWFAPEGQQATRAEVDERVGGRYRVWQAGPGGDAGGFECELLELVPNERIVLRWGFVGPDRLDGPHRGAGVMAPPATSPACALGARGLGG